MLASVQGIFQNGKVELRESPPGVERAEVIVTFLPERDTAKANEPFAANQRMLALLQSWQDHPLSPEERSELDDFEEFQQRPPC